MASRLRGTSSKLVSYALLVQLGERTAVKRGRHWFESNTERFDSVLLGSESTVYLLSWWNR